MIVAKFGVRKFLRGEQLAVAEMVAASRYYNALVDIERWRRKEYGRIRSKIVPGLGEIDEAYAQLDEWIGAHAGPTGERGKIRAKRQAATAKTMRDGRAPVPQKGSVDVTDEVDAIDELKRWRKEAGAMAKPLRAEFNKLVAPTIEAHATRAAALRAEWGSGPGDNHAKRRSDMAVRLAMLEEETVPEAWKLIARLDLTSDALESWVKEARWLSAGTYSAIQRIAIPAACKRPPPRPDGEPRKPKIRPAFSRARRRKIGWELKGRTWGDLLAGRDSNVAITNVRERGGANGGRKKWIATAEIRLRAEDRVALSADPTFYRPAAHGADGWRASVDIVIHRPIPDDTAVRQVYLVPFEASRGKWDYSVQFVLDPSAPLIQRAAGEGDVQVDLCWTQHEDTLIVAHVNGVPLTLPGRSVKQDGTVKHGIVESLRFAEELRSVSDKLFDAARDTVSDFFRKRPSAAHPAFSGMGSWRAHWKFHGAIKAFLAALGASEAERSAWIAWRDARLAAKEDLFEMPFERYAAQAQDLLGERRLEVLLAYWLGTWARKDEHLERMGAGVRRTAERRRKDFYRVTAARLATTYARCAVGGAVDLDALALRDKAEDRPAELPRAARHNRYLACLYEFKLSLAAAFGPSRYSERSGAAEPPGPARSSTEDAGSSTERGADSIAPAAQ